MRTYNIHTHIECAVYTCTTYFLLHPEERKSETKFLCRSQRSLSHVYTYTKHSARARSMDKLLFQNRATLLPLPLLYGDTPATRALASCTSIHRVQPASEADAQPRKMPSLRCFRRNFAFKANERVLALCICRPGAWVTPMFYRSV